jgi:hypothetical protein
MRSLIHQIQELMERAEPSINVVEVLPVMSHQEDQTLDANPERREQHNLNAELRTN